MTAKERRGFRHDQIGLEVFAGKRRRVEIRESDGDTGHGIHNVIQVNGVASLVVPGLEVANLDSSDAQQDAQNFRTTGPLRHRRIEARASLLNRSEVKSCGVGNRLGELRDIKGLGRIRRDLA